MRWYVSNCLAINIVDSVTDLPLKCINLWNDIIITDKFYSQYFKPDSTFLSSLNLHHFV